MLDERDVLSSMSDEQIGLFLDAMSAWGGPHACLVDALRPRKLEGSILVAGERDLPERPDFSSCPFFPTRHTSWEEADRLFLSALIQDEDCRFVSLFNYTCDSRDFTHARDSEFASYYAKNDNSTRFVRYIGSVPVLVLERSEISVYDTRMMRESFYSPIVALSHFDKESDSQILFDPFVSMYCNIFDNEKFMSLRQKWQ